MAPNAYAATLTDREVTRLLVRGEAKADRVAGLLVRASVWFAVVPYPDDFWEFAVKPDSAVILRSAVDRAVG